jgi:hypothetical protein
MYEKASCVVNLRSVDNKQSHSLNSFGVSLIQSGNFVSFIICSWAVPRSELV